MSKQILILNSSPRKGGNTDALTDALAEGVTAAGNRPVLLHLRDMEIHPCHGCYACAAGRGTPCVQKDDMQQVFDALAASDGIVFAAPLYWWQFNAPMKAAIDRLFAVAASAGMKMPPKDCAMVIAAEGTGEENFAQIVPYYKTCLVQNLGWADKGMVLARGVNMPGDVQKTGFLEEARRLGASF